MFEARPGYTLGWFPKHSTSAKEAPTVASFIREHLTMDKLNEFRQERMANMRPWLGEFLNRDQFKLPANMSNVGDRLSSNLRHFASNYLIIVLLLLIYAVYFTYIFVLLY